MSMRRIVMIGCVVTLAATAAFAKISGDENKRLSEAATIINEMRIAADGGIPQDLWNKSECVVVIPSLKKAAFVFGGEYGSGVMSCRAGSNWSAPVFMQLAKGSVGFQIGAQQTDLVLLIMNRRGLDRLLSDKVTLGADASIAAGPVGRSATAATDAQLSAEILSYSRSQGLFAGINLSGGALKPDQDANARAYGSAVAPRDVVTGSQPAALVEATSFIEALRQSAGRPVPAN